MRKSFRSCGILAVCAALAFGGIALAREPHQTVVTIPEMDCAHCAKHIEAQLKKVKGVATLKTNVPARTITITPAARTILSPRDLWEAVEKEEKMPSKLEGPHGTFTKKPKS